MSDDIIGRLNAALSDRYRILDGLGEGGMATVFLADDLRHERKVALKVLKPELAAVVGAERFLAEIKTTANLQHPHILPLFDSGEADSFLFYVMPYVEGETLRERIDREKQLPVEEAVRIATAIANALHYAHEHGVVHRDIKPGNILLQAGQPVVGDFGIALAVGSAGGARLTETGLSVGTPYYMSPEQATGDQLVGPSSDIYALGAVLYELLTGDPPYMGSTAQAVLGQIIAGDPVSAAKKRRAIPPHVDAAIRKSLEKLPADRFTSAADFARALEDPGFRHGEATEATAAEQAGRWKAATVGAAILAVVFAGLAVHGYTRPQPAGGVERFATPFLPDQVPEAIRSEGSALAPDGSFLVYRSGSLTSPAPLELALRRWDDLAAVPIRETAGAWHPTVSPDGEELAFRIEGEIRVLAFAGGPVRTLTPGDAPEWGSDGWIYVAADSGAVRVPASGGAVEVLTRLADGEVAHHVHDVLPGGTRALVTVFVSESETEVRGLDLETGEMTFLVAGAHPTYLPSGHLVYGTGCDWIGTAGACDIMMAAPFDPRRMELESAPVAIQDDLVAWSFSEDGSKLYYSQSTGAGGGQGPSLQLTWVTRDGRATPVDPDWTFRRGTDVNQGWSISPDGSRVALREYTEEGYDIWVKELDDGPRSRLTFSEAHDRMPVWAPDGRTVTFLSDRGGEGLAVWSRPADGTREARLLVDPEPLVAAAKWTPDGEWILLRTSAGSEATSARDILGYRPGVDTVPVPLVADRYREVQPEVSPDGRWLLYASDETGRYETYVRPFPDVTSGRWLVSVDGGRSPRWAHSGEEIFFLDPADRMMVAAVEAEGEAFGAGVPRMLFESDSEWLSTSPFGLEYDVAPDDERFMVATQISFRNEADGSVPNVVLVNNFARIIQERAPR